MKNCAKCGKDLTDTNGDACAGMTICIRICEPIAGAESLQEQNIKFLQKQMGKYAIADYNFCYECLLDTLMGVAS